MRDALVSVIIPIHNGEKYLDDAINSVLHQSHSQFEIIAVDDGSTDLSAEAVKQHGSRVRYVYQDHAGTGAARNTGVAMSRGDYLAFLDQDDVWEPEKLSCQIDAFTNTPTLDAVFGYLEQFPSGQIAGDKGLEIPISLKRRPGISPSGMLVARHAFHRVGWFDVCLKIAEWADWYLRAVDCGLRMKILEVTIAKRRIHENNKGRVLQCYRNEYVRVLKASLDRNRQGVLS